MNSAFNNYLKGEALPAEVSEAMNTYVPPIYLNEKIDSFGRREIEQFLKIVPAKVVLMKIDDSWDDEEETLLGLMAGRFIERIFIYGCSHEIKYLPTSAHSVSVRARGDCTAIRQMVKMENLREITMIGGKMDEPTWVTIGERLTKIRKLELIGTRIECVRFGYRALGRINDFITKGVKLNGEEIGMHDLVRRMREFN